tara:strand:- start:225 stop:539 length:315 start_codon:yes stop_codon:yes gene_type:complete
MSIVIKSALNILVLYDSLLYEYKVSFASFIVFGYFCIADTTEINKVNCFQYYEGPGVYYATLNKCGDKIDEIIAKINANNDSLTPPHCGNYYTEGQLDCLEVKP